MTRAVAYRLPSDLVGRIKDAAAEANLSATTYVRQAIEARLDAPPLTAVAMHPDVPRETCAHPFRNEFGVCRGCGHER